MLRTSFVIVNCMTYVTVYQPVFDVLQTKQRVECLMCIKQKDLFYIYVYDLDIWIN